MALKQLIGICEKYSKEYEIAYNTTKSVCMFIRPQHMCHIEPVKQFLYGSKLSWVDVYKYLGYFITSDLKDDRDIRRQVRAIYCRGNMIIRKFSKCSVNVKNQLLGHMLIVYTVVHSGIIIQLLHSIWLELRIIMFTELSC